MVASVMAAISSRRPARLANSSIISCSITVDSMSATRNFFARHEAGTTLMSMGRPERAGSINRRVTEASISN